MRRFVDSHGKGWEAVLGRGSWGLYYLLFAPTDGAGEVREVTLAASSYEEAVREFDALTDEDLATMLDRSTPKSDQEV